MSLLRFGSNEKKILESLLKCDAETASQNNNIACNLAFQTDAFIYAALYKSRTSRCLHRQKQMKPSQLYPRTNFVYRLGSNLNFLRASKWCTDKKTARSSDLRKLEALNFRGHSYLYVYI